MWPLPSALGRRGGRAAARAGSGGPGRRPALLGLALGRAAPHSRPAGPAQRIDEDACWGGAAAGRDRRLTFSEQARVAGRPAPSSFASGASWVDFVSQPAGRGRGRGWDGEGGR